MIWLTRRDGSKVCINTMNIQWIEEIPDTVVTFLGGARLFVLEKTAEILAAMGQGQGRLPGGRSVEEFHA